MTKFKVDHKRPPHEALTLEQYRRLDLDRPLTDPPVGSTTAGRRATDAHASAAIPVTPNPGGPR